MFKSLVFAAALIGAPAYAETTIEAEETTVEVEETTSAAEEETEVEIVEEEEEEEDFISKWFTPNTIATIMLGLTYLGTVLKLFSSYKTLKVSHNLSLENVQENLKNILEKKMQDSISEIMEKYMPDLVSSANAQNEVLKSFSKVLALSQENTPESRVAILEIIENLGTLSKETIETSKKIVEDAKIESEAKKEELKENLDEIFENTEVM